MTNNLLGSRIGPRIAQMVADAITHTKRQTLDLERQLHVSANWELITAMGHEAAFVNRALYGPTLAAGAPLPPDLKELLESAVTGKHQVSSVLMGALGGVTGSVLGILVGNYLAPATYAAVGADPLMLPDVPTLATLAAANIIDPNFAAGAAGSQGINKAWFDAMRKANVRWPEVAILLELMNRSLISEADVDSIMALLAYDATSVQQIKELRHKLLTPADAALAVLRGNIDLATGQGIAAQNGYSSDAFQTLIDNTGEPPPFMEMLSLWRRDLIDTPTLDRAIRESRIRDEWIDITHQMAIIPPTQTSALEALVKSQTTQDEALRRYKEAGGDETWFETEFGTIGAAPSPVELGTLANRGIIPWDGVGGDVVSFHQGVLEGLSKNKYVDAWKALAVYLPPPRTIVAMVKDGAMQPQEALDLLQKQGLTAELAAEYVHGASNTKLAGQRQLAIGQIQELYEYQALSEAQAHDLLEAHGFAEEEIAYVIWLADFTRLRKFMEAGIGRTHTLYVNHKIDVNEVTTTLDALGVPSAQREHLITLWGYERAANVRTLTTAQILSAMKAQIITADEATTRLVADGYTAADAAILVQLG